MAAAEVIDLEERRRALRHAGAGDPMPFSWGALLMAGDGRDFVSRYARLGLHPILIHGLADDGSCTCGRSTCEAIGKHPVHAGWQKAPPDAAKLDAALAENWRYNLGLRMGEQPSGVVLVAIDIDGDRSLLDPLEQRLGTLPPTLTAATSKGLHLIYRLREAARVPPNRVRLADGVDVRSQGGQIVVAPSKHRSGTRYRWLDAREPAVLP